MPPYLDRIARPAFVEHIELARHAEDIERVSHVRLRPLPHWSRGRVTLLGDAAHPDVPDGLQRSRPCHPRCDQPRRPPCPAHRPAHALRAYRHDRLPATTEVVLRNRQGGPEGVIDIVEQRAPDGFTDLTDVIDHAELEAIVTSYAHAARASHEQVNSTSPGR